ncbi:PREDICTED: ATG8-interacting protein 1-like [Nicotiana attenuata]|uniref:Atg8-interacting protein 1 n=1 Tax=Nicotiana attenuata TaxID=49451 RepID=A0A1J6I4N2_NICAT|nr:PREDICTED: ATG8-interacting protein 1-like [Nicotiana attenuata]XP_019252201.1 PREDICTED: ATG8-interacting protein 1-like [Nicotiana attenuata]OIS99465.1 atg8-interacting protein 1 [Nicotiana attenuata]
MANNAKGEENTPRGNEWEVVTLTKSVYAAAPGPKQVDLVDDNSAEYVAETSDPMFMSGHFVLPQNQHEDSAFQPDNDEILNGQGGKDASPEFVADKGVNSDIYEESTKTKVLSTMEFPGDQIFDEKGSILSACGAEFEEDAVLQGLGLVDKEQNFFDAPTYNSFHDEEPMGGSASTEESNIVAEPVEPFHQGIDSGMSNFPKAKDEDNYDAENLPCQAWWKRQAVSLIAHAKDANAFWSIFIAAAVMGLVVIGQRWQLERWQVVQMKWQFGGNDERMGKTIISPISRLKDMMIGSDRRGSFIRGSASAQR